MRRLLAWAARPPTHGFSSSSAAILSGTLGGDSIDVGEDVEGEYAASPACALGGVDVAEAEGSMRESLRRIRAVEQGG